jgi:hypothetical protein
MDQVTPRGTEVDNHTQLVKLRSDHETLEGQLNALDALIYLTPDEQVERKNIQKMKLRLKDRIERLKEKPS